MKKIVSMMLVLVMLCTFVGCGEANLPDPNEPGIVGREYVEEIMSIKEATKYEVAMEEAQGYWVVTVIGKNAHHGWANCGMYDHYPSEKEIDILWERRISIDDLYNEIAMYVEMYE